MTDADAPLELIGLDAGAATVYRDLLARGGGTVDDVTAAFGLGTGQALALMERLHHSGLLSRRSSGEYLTVDPRHALRAPVLSRERHWRPSGRPPGRSARCSTRPGGRAAANRRRG
ncbi:hypothetical protein [Actinacidiphila sp. bgisy167]|uniref:hypothetical protein n=1 Tax=Actinacidiphila sp. bgisy167 TaxID=3413797 RepID=UPI003D73A84D